MKTVKILVTGGTIDKVHDTFSEGLDFPKDGTSQIPKVLLESRCDFADVQLLMMKDSLYFDDVDRDAIVAAVEAAAEDAIVVTHGTGTMGESARWLAARITGKTVVFTGAMRPHSLSVSDGPFNLGGAMIAAQTLTAGVYGVMNGRVFEAAHLTKNTAQSRFDL